MTGEFPAQMASNAENVSIWWRHHVMKLVAVVGVKRIQQDYNLKFRLTINSSS